MDFDDVEAGWGQLKDRLVTSAINVVCCGGHHQSDWFLEGEQLLSHSLVGVMIPLLFIKGLSSVNVRLSVQLKILRKLRLRRL